MITKERAEEIRSKCRELSHNNPKTRKSGAPWSDYMGEVITPEEDEEIKHLMIGSCGGSNYVHAFYRFLNGTADESSIDNPLQ